ncbi:MAG: glycoside hydrolase family 31 protein [Mycoplasmatota bacterium]|nr:glycoside hydrolase family 31 protein [Mycoplasmatota bacterium]
MYPLGRQFTVDSAKAVSDKKAIFAGNNYRISIISERVVRLEFSATGQFVDKPTQLIKRRNLGLPDFSIRQDPHLVEISTKYFTLTYIKGQPFVGPRVDPMKNLKITLRSREKDRNKDWYVGHPEAKNLHGNMISVDMGIPKNLENGLYSLDGFASFDDSKSKIIMEDGTLAEPLENHLDIYVFMYDRDFKQALLDYFKMTGAPALIPRYALGNWWCRNTTYNDTTLYQLIRNFERNKIPLSVMLFDHDWHYRNVGNHKDLKAGFTFNKDLFIEPEKTIEDLHKRGIRVGLCVNPTNGIYPHEMYYKQASEALGVTEPKIILFDPLNPKLLDVMFKMLLHPLEVQGVDFFWNDSTGDNDINKLWALNHYMFLDSGRVNTKRPMLLGRGSVYAPHRYPVSYGGSSEISWDALKKLPFMYLNAANIGVSWWSHDVGGNHGGIEDGELYVRYLQLSTFSPILRFHAARGTYYKKEPWLWDVKTEQIATDYLRLRHRLIPYLYTEAYNYTKSGTPLIQPFYYNYMWTYDDELYKNQYYFGSQLLVCPILNTKDVMMDRTIHRFFIPDGTWYDFITGKKFPGNKKYISFFKEEDYPVFAHAGSIIPLSNRSDYNNTGLPIDLEIQIFPGVSNTYTMYEDDGVTALYREGYYLKTSIDYNYLRNNYTVVIRSIDGKSGIVPDKRNYKMVFRNTKKPQEVLTYFNAEKLPFEAYIDGNDFVVELKDVPTIGQVTINCKGKDIEIEAARLINDEVDSILMDLKINTYLKEEIADIMFGKESISKKRIAIRKLKKKGLSKEYIGLFLKLLEYLSEV